MATKRNREAFLIFKRGTTLYAKFWNPETESYDIRRSTGIVDTGRRGDRVAASAAAQRLLDSGIVKRSDDGPLLAYVEQYWKERTGITERYRSDMLGFCDKAAGFGPVASARLSTTTVELLNRLSDYLEGKMSARGVQRAIGAFVVPLKRAKKRGLTPRLDLSLGIDTPTPQHRERGRLTLEEIKRILTVEVAAYPDPRELVATLVAVLAGLRRGELRALRWRAIDAKAQTITVADNFTDVDGFHGVKSGSQRTVQVPAVLLERLAQYRVWSPFDRNDDLLFFGTVEGGRIRNASTNPGAVGSIPCAANVPTRGFHRVLTHIGIDEEEQERRHLVLHGGRHTFASLAVERVSSFASQRLTGHKDIRTLERYAHPERKEAERFARGLNRDLKKRSS